MESHFMLLGAQPQILRFPRSHISRTFGRGRGGDIAMIGLLQAVMENFSLLQLLSLFIYIPCYVPLGPQTCKLEGDPALCSFWSFSMQSSSSAELNCGGVVHFVPGIANLYCFLGRPPKANIALPPILIPNSKNPPNRKQLISLLQSCRHSNQITPIHAKIIRNNYHNDAFVVFELLRVCSNLSSINYASKIFSFTENPNVYLYTALIDGFVLSGSFISGIHLYYQMINLSIVPDNYVITSVLEACGFQLALKQGIQVHCQVLKLGLSSKRLMRLKLMKFYGKCGSLKDAERLFDEMPERDVVASTIMINSYFEHGLIQEAIRVFNLTKSKDTVCWTAVIDGLVRNGEMNRALEVFREMQREDVRPNEVTIVCVLSACSQLGTLELGRWVHSYMGKYGIGINHFVGGALINMYSRCGDIDEAWRVFEEMKERNVITYNSMIVGFSLHGKSSEAIELFRGMTKQGLEPTSVTFVDKLEKLHSKSKDKLFQIKGGKTSLVQNDLVNHETI
ncbi:pentatricopeptide repeat-containing protein, putative [Ricinus communis]|uniref:Pentatricopeptide repeat-containing protein, putative n=1 Tax=Ricinus communis TaxID=3988 RepID=B9SMQ7_RICCO|nr:pentatricopeptide repeat-containing protein, putative [Ricinus communis]